MLARFVDADTASIAEEIWSSRYRWSGDGSVDDTWQRVANGSAQAEAPEDRLATAQRFYECLKGYQLLPAGRILANTGTKRRGTLFNCFVMGTVPDSIQGIFHALTESALTMQQGGGIGVDFSTIRPRDALVHGSGESASGPVSFMETWDAMCGTMMSAGYRRGAMMACLRADHPDIEEFIDAKRQAERLRRFNLSVLVPDAFMTALAEGKPWELVFDGKVQRTVDPRVLWERLMRATYQASEPGVIFIDRVNAANNLRYCETISASNPCAEQMLPPYGACLLSSINLATLVERPFQRDAALNEERLGELARCAVRFMDDVIDVSEYPLEEQAAEAKRKRRIGLGVTGLADALIFCGLRYGTHEAAAMSSRWLSIIERESYRTSAELARQKGPFPLYSEQLLRSPVFSRLDGKTISLVKEHGLRNGCLTSIAPTGTISLLAGNVSSGIEPVFDHVYSRRIRRNDGTIIERRVQSFSHALWRDMNGAKPLSDAFVCAHDLLPEEHLRMLAAAQRHVDSAISKTINLSADVDFDVFKSVYASAYALGCKGCTTYRPSELRGEVLVSSPSQPHGQQAAPKASAVVEEECAVCG